jgi:cephalosporin hydroxylase
MNSSELYKKIKENYRLQQIPQEWIDFIDFLQETKPQTVIEIGAFAGGCAFTFSHFSKLIISIDNNDKFKKREPIKKRAQLFFINKDSHSGSTVKKVERILEPKNLKADLLFIDGDHTAKGARKDLKLYKKYVKPGGYIVLHDILKSAYHTKLNCFVYVLWEELKKEYPSYKEIIHSNKWGGIGIVKI